MDNKLQLSLKGEIFINGVDVTKEAINIVAQRMVLKSKSAFFKDVADGKRYKMSVVEVDE